jgi:hypothetical protein
MAEGTSKGEWRIADEVEHGTRAAAAREWPKARDKVVENGRRKALVHIFAR